MTKRLFAWDSGGTAMVVEEFPSFWNWLFPDLPFRLGALFTFLFATCFLTFVGVFIGYLVSAIRHGPVEGFFAIAKSIAQSLPDLGQTSPRRTLAIAKLAVQESIRRRVLLAAFAIFAMALLVGGWFLDVKSNHPDRLYISFVLWGTQLLTLILVVVLSAFSLPTDIKNKTIYTVVTKPVRAVEIVIGRTLGFAAIGTALLGIMCVISYFFVVRGLSHRHEIAPTNLVEIEPETDDPKAVAFAPGQSLGKEGFTTSNSHHRHKVTVSPDGYAELETVMGHTHAITLPSAGAQAESVVGPPQGMLQARVPIYGQLRFLDRTGATKRTGVNVGNEWTYRSYIAGGPGSLAAAIWEFDGIREGLFPNDELPIEMTLSVYRTHKGDMQRPVSGELVIKHPTASVQSIPRIFVSAEYATQRLFIPRKLRGQDASGKSRDIDLFDDLVDDNGKLEIRIQCADPGQYFGMAQADLYLRAKDKWFVANFFKGYLSIWLQMIIVVCFGVMFSTRLSAPVALLATLAVLAVGHFSQFITQIGTSEMPGGGPLESMVRTATQKNLMVDLEPGAGTALLKAYDAVVLWFVKGITYLVPDFSSFNTSDYVAYGFDINGHLVSTHFVTMLAFVLALSVVSYYLLRTREIAA